MKKFITVLFVILFLTSNSYGNKVSDYITNLIPGEGDTEFSIDLRENYSADYSILLVRELSRNDNGNYFTQLSLFNTEKNNDERVTANFGLGKRILSDDKLFLSGFNLFFDFDDKGNAR